MLADECFPQHVVCDVCGCVSYTQFFPLANYINRFRSVMLMHNVDVYWICILLNTQIAVFNRGLMLHGTMCLIGKIDNAKLFCCPVLSVWSICQILRWKEQMQMIIQKQGRHFTCELVNIVTVNKDPWHGWIQAVRKEFKTLELKTGAFHYLTGRNRTVT